MKQQQLSPISTSKLKAHAVQLFSFFSNLSLFATAQVRVGSDRIRVRQSGHSGLRSCQACFGFYHKKHQQQVFTFEGWRPRRTSRIRARRRSAEMRNIKSSVKTNSSSNQMPSFYFSYKESSMVSTQEFQVKYFKIELILDPPLAPPTSFPKASFHIFFLHNLN